MSKGYAFPDEDDDLTNYKGESTHIMIPGNLLQEIISKEKALILGYKISNYL